MCAKIITIKRTKDLNYFSLCALNLFNTQVSHLELNYWNKWTFPQHSSLLRCTCISFQSVQIYTLLYVGYWLKETFLKCLNYWGYGRSPNLHPSAIVRPWLTKWSTIVVLISSDMRLCPWSLLPLPLFCHFHASFLLFFLSSADPDRFLDVHPSSELFYFCVVLCLYMLPIEGSWDAPLSYFR